MRNNIENELCSDEFKIFSGALKYTNPLLYAAAAEIYKNRADFKKALIFYEKALVLSPFDVRLMFNKGVCEILTENFDCALKTFRLLLTITPDNIDAQLNLALAHEFSGENETALLIYSKIFEQYPNCSVAAIRAACIYIRCEKFVPALEFLLKIRSSDVSADVNGMRALCFEKTGDLNRARRFYGKALRQTENLYPDEDIKQKFRTLLKKSVKKSLLSVSTVG